MMMHPKEKQIEQFWQEVSKTIDSLFQHTDERLAKMVVQGYEAHLKSIDENLTFHFERDVEDTGIEMIIGCDGFTNSIASVLRLVAAAPLIRGLRVIAFNNRHMVIPERVTLGDREYGIEEFWFSLRVQGRRLSLSIYLDESMETEQPSAAEAAMVFLDAMLGEYDLMTRVSALHWYDLPEDPEDFGLQPLTCLREAFDAQRRKVDMIGITLH